MPRAVIGLPRAASDSWLATAILLAAEGLSNTDIATRRSQPLRAASRCRNASVRRACRVLRRELGRGGRSVPRSPQRAEVKTLACVLPAEQGVPPLCWSSAVRPETGSSRSMKLAEQFMTQEPYFSVAQRNVPQANNFVDVDGAQQALLAFGRPYEQSAHRFEWKFTRQGLHRLLVRLEQPNPALQLAA